MKELSLEEIQKESLNVLLEIDEICKSHGWNYFLAFGTLLGAVRHQGFIPWDDDIDLFLLRKDFDEFVEYFETKYDGHLTLHNWKNTENYWYPIPRVSNDEYKYVNTVKNEKPFALGCFVDIYPLDNWCNDKDKQVECFQKCFRLRRMYYSYVNPRATTTKAKVIGRYIMKIEFLLKSVNYKNKGEYVESQIRKILESYDDKSHQWLGSFTSWGTQNTPYSADWFDSVVYLDFEGHKLPAPAGYREFLTANYGNYMELPPDEKRKPQHDYIILCNEK